MKGRGINRAVELCFLLALGVAAQAMVQLSLGGWQIGPVFLLPFLLNLSALLLPLCAARLLLGRLPLALFTLCSAVALSLLNQRKIALLNEPLLVADLFRFQLSPLVLRFVGAPEWLAVGFLLFLPFGLGIAWWKAKKGRPEEKMVAGLLLLSALLILAAGFRPFRLRWITFQIPRFQNEISEARAYGFFVHLLLNARNLRIETPPDYSEAVVRETLRQEKFPAVAEEKTRDLVVVLLESFSDLQGAGVGFREKVLPFVTALRKQAAARELNSPVVGGLTANAEYEVLTGLPWKFLPGGTVPYLSYIRHPLPSVVSELHKRGFETLALHPGNRKFWNREEVYRHLGFDSFISSENWPKPGRIYDRDLFHRSVELLRVEKRRPQFQFLITLDTHGPYLEPAPEHGWISGRGFPAKLERRINRYADLMHGLDGDLEIYFQELKKLPRPPVVVLFGDHQPEMSVEIEQSGRKFNPYSILALVWNGSDSPEQGRDLYCLAPSLLENAGVSLSRFFSYVNHFCRQAGALDSTVQGNPVLSPLQQSFRALAFDRLFGAQFSER